MPYEVNVDDVMIVITTLLVEDIDASAKQFGTYKSFIAKQTANVGTPKAGKKRKRKVYEASRMEEGEGFGKP